jgi:hypothetical protein
MKFAPLGAEGNRFSRERETPKSVIVSGKTRWLIIVTGCLTSVAGVALGLALGLAFPAGILIIGAIVQPKFHRAGRGLLCAGALLLSFFVFDIGFFMLTERHAGLGIMTADIVTLFSVLLVTACDAAIVIEEVRIRRAERAVRPALREESV